MASSLIAKLTAQKDGEAGDFLNDLVRELWPNINVAGCNMIKEIVEPMFKTMLPGPLKALHFTKLDLGPVPITFSNVTVSRTEADGIKIEMNVSWLGQCSVGLDAPLIPDLGVKSVQLHGRLIVLLCPITNIIPLIGAVQFSFVNPPVLNLDFTGAAEVADLSIIDSTVREIILGIVNSMFTLPNRYFLRMDMTADYFKTYHEPLGVLRITVEKATGFAKESTSKAKKLLAKLTRAAPDCYAKVEVGAEAAWKTSVKDNSVEPVWNETQDFVVSDYDQCIKIDIRDKDVNGDDDVGMAVTTVREIVRGNKHLELLMYLKDKETDGKVSITCEYFSLETANSSFTAEEHRGPNKLCGIANVLVASARNIKGQRDQLKPSVVVTWGAKHRFQTAIIADAPGTDINNPNFDQSFRMLGTSDLMNGSQNIRIALMNGTTEVGASEISFEEVHKAPKMTLDKAFDVGGGTTVRASICVRGVGPASVSSGASLPVRTA